MPVVGCPGPEADEIPRVHDAPGLVGEGTPARGDAASGILIGDQEERDQQRSRDQEWRPPAAPRPSDDVDPGLGCPSILTLPSAMATSVGPRRPSPATCSRLGTNRPWRAAARATLPPRGHPPGASPQLLDHRPHRPRQVDAGGSAARADPHGRGPPDDEPGPRLDGPRAREGDHDQGPGRPPRVRRPRRQPLRPEPHRHARPRRLRVRGQPQPPGLRRRDPRRRRDPGHRGPDARQRPPRAARGPDADPGPQQDRPALGRPRHDHRGARERPRDPARGGDPRQRQGRHRRPGDPRGDRRAHPRAEGRPGEAAPGADLRQPLRRVQGRRDLRPAGRRHASHPRRDPADGLRRARRSRSSSASSGPSSSRSSSSRPARWATSRPG